MPYQIYQLFLDSYTKKPVDGSIKKPVDKAPKKPVDVSIKKHVDILYWEFFTAWM